VGRENGDAEWAGKEASLKALSLYSRERPRENMET
jgi:phosphopantetheinyl transferase (holo-ACP synthase)